MNNSGDAELIDTDFFMNTTIGDGGAIINSGTLTGRGGESSFNRAGGAGGAIASVDDGTSR